MDSIHETLECHAVINGPCDLPASFVLVVGARDVWRRGVVPCVYQSDKR